MKEKQKRRKRDRPVIAPAVVGSPPPAGSFFQARIPGLQLRVQSLFAVITSGVAVCLALLAINIGSIHRFNNADSLIPVFVSLVHWTPFYWDQARFGMLSPLLVSPVRDPLLNLLLQTQINIVSLFGTFLLLDRLVNAPATGWTRLARACLAMSLWLLVMRDNPKVYQTFLLPGLPYSLSLCLLMAAFVGAGFGSTLVTVRNLRFAEFAGLALLALYVNEANLPVALIFAVALPAESGYGLARRSAAVGAILAAELAVRFFSSFYGTPLGFHFAPLEYLPDAVLAMLDQMWALLVRPSAAIVLLLLLVGCAAMTFVFWRTDFRRQMLTLAVVGTTSAVVALLTTDLEWLEYNLYDVRYWATPILLILMSSALAVVSRAGIWAPRGTAVGAAVLFASVSVYTFGFPSMERTRASVIEGMARDNRALASLGCTHFIGNPWDVWNSAFAATLIDPSSPIIPVTIRSQHMLEQGLSHESRAPVYCGICGDADLEPLRRAFQIPDLKVVRQLDRVCLMAPK